MPAVLAIAAVEPAKTAATAKRLDRTTSNTLTDEHANSENQTSEKLSFEDALRQLDEIVGDLEQGRLGLSESLARYEEGVGHLKRCYEMLGAAEKKIELLSGVDADGNPITEPFDEAVSYTHLTLPTTPYV